MLDARQEAILKAVVEEYISQAVPVSSFALTDKYFHQLSSATIRNELAKLERGGFLAHPYTSAGRIPTDKGYQYFVEELMEARPPTRRFRRDLQGAIDNPSQLAQVLSIFSENLVLYFEDDYPVVQEGLRAVLSQPEFEQRERVLQFLAFVSKLSHSPQLLERLLPDERPRVFIGRQVKIRSAPSAEFSLIAVWLNRQAGKLLSLLGPSRMPYDRNLGALEYIKQLLYG